MCGKRWRGCRLNYPRCWRHCPSIISDVITRVLEGPLCLCFNKPVRDAILKAAFTTECCVPTFLISQPSVCYLGVFLIVDAHSPADDTCTDSATAAGHADR